MNTYSDWLLSLPPICSENPRKLNIVCFKSSLSQCLKNLKRYLEKKETPKRIAREVKGFLDIDTKICQRLVRAAALSIAA